ncbi:MAG: XisH family protein [Cyanobacteria bacterium J06629_19]
MPAKDIYHNQVKAALASAGWTITHDPLLIRLTKKKLYVDLGAERIIAAERGSEKIAVEIKSFTRPSDMKDLEEALGQCVLYSRLLARYEPERKVYLAVTDEVYESVFEEEAGQILIQDGLLNIVTFDAEREELIRWVP